MQEMRLEIVGMVRYGRNGGDFDIFLNELIFGFLLTKSDQP